MFAPKAESPYILIHTSPTKLTNQEEGFDYTISLDMCRTATSAVANPSDAVEFRTKSAVPLVESIEPPLATEPNNTVVKC